MDEAVDFCRELMELRVSFRMDIMNRLYNGSNDYGVGWKKRCVVVNGNDYNLMEYMKKLRLNMWLMTNMNLSFNPSLYSSKTNRKVSIYVVILIEGYYFLFLMSIHLIWTMEISKPFSIPSILHSWKSLSSMNSNMIATWENGLVITNGDWSIEPLNMDIELNPSMNTVMIKVPPLIVIKSDEGWIFGGYTTQSWEVAHPDEFGSIYYDMIWYDIQ